MTDLAPWLFWPLLVFGLVLGYVLLYWLGHNFPFTRNAKTKTKR